MLTKKRESSQVNDTNFYLKKLEKEEQVKPKTNQRKTTVEIKAEINAIKNRERVEEKNSIIETCEVRQYMILFIYLSFCLI